MVIVCLAPESKFGVTSTLSPAESFSCRPCRRKNNQAQDRSPGLGGNFGFASWNTSGRVDRRHVLVVEGEAAEFVGGGGDGALDGEALGGGAGPEAVAAGVVQDVLRVGRGFHGGAVGDE